MTARAKSVLPAPRRPSRGKWCTPRSQRKRKPAAEGGSVIGAPRDKACKDVGVHRGKCAFLGAVPRKHEGSKAWCGKPNFRRRPANRGGRKLAIVEPSWSGMKLACQPDGRLTQHHVPALQGFPNRSEPPRNSAALFPDRAFGVVRLVQTDESRGERDLIHSHRGIDAPRVRHRPHSTS